MKRTIGILLMSLLPVPFLTAQDFDKQILAETDIQGTARYVSMAGAFTALGGDVSAAVDNPAALGVFRHGELSLTGGFYFSRVKATGLVDDARRVSVPQIAWVIHFNHSDRQKGMLQSSLMLQYHRLKQFNRNSTMQASAAPVSLTDLMADMTNGLDESTLKSENWATNPDIGTLSKLGYELYLIYPDTGDPKQWHSVLNEGETVSNTLQLTERGSTNEYSLSWGGNISNRVYIGLGANLRSVSYSREADYTENFFKGGTFTTHSSVVQNGFGFDATLGLIARPTDMLRIGFSYQTPVWMTMKTRSSVRGNSNIYSEASFPATDDSYTDNSYRLPMRLTAGAALQFSRGLLSFEYDWQHQAKNSIEDIHRFKVGGEAVVSNNVFLRAGYAYQSPFLKNEILFTPDATDWRADTDFRQLLGIHYASFGVGFRNRFIVAEAAYQFGYDKSRQYAFSRYANNTWQSMSYDTYTMTHRLVLTLAWTMRR
ncbi:MAG: hypothetical protein IJ650_03010 [Paludibacteraceae bacterium]|nr:hypothetical protein [Paludibacteraceae bacterium]